MSTDKSINSAASLWAPYALIFSGVVAALQIGKLPPALPSLSLALNLTLTQAGFLLSFIQLAGMTLALAIGLSADGFGLKRSMCFGLVGTRVKLLMKRNPLSSNVRKRRRRR